MRNYAMLSLLLLAALSGIASAQTDQELDIKGIAADVQKRIEACPRRETVTAFDRGHHKEVWAKAAWGPPMHVFVDVKANDSLLYPYILTVEFYLDIVGGQEKKTKAEAESDSNLSPLPLMQGSKYRNTFLLNKDGLHLKTTEFLDTNLDGTPNGWKERSPWPDACWDQIR